MAINNLIKNKFELVFDESLYDIVNEIIEVDFPGLGISYFGQKWKGLTNNQPGGDLDFDVLDISMIVNEDMSNVKKFIDWIFELKNPETSENGSKKLPATLICYRPDGNKIRFKVDFTDVFPVNMSKIKFKTNIDDTEYEEVTITFVFNKYEIKGGLI